MSATKKPANVDTRIKKLQTAVQYVVKELKSLRSEVAALKQQAEDAPQASEQSTAANAEEVATLSKRVTANEAQLKDMSEQIESLLFDQLQEKKSGEVEECMHSIF